MSQVKLTKSGRPDKRCTTSKINASKAHAKNRALIEAGRLMLAQKYPDPEVSEDDSESEQEQAPAPESEPESESEESEESDDGAIYDKRGNRIVVEQLTRSRHRAQSPVKKRKPVKKQEPVQDPRIAELEAKIAALTVKVPEPVKEAPKKKLSRAELIREQNKLLM